MRDKEKDKIRMKKYYKEKFMDKCECGNDKCVKSRKCVRCKREGNYAYQQIQKAVRGERWSSICRCGNKKNPGSWRCYDHHKVMKEKYRSDLTKQDHKCECGKKISKVSTRCMKCFRKTQKKKMQDAWKRKKNSFQFS